MINGTYRILSSGSVIAEYKNMITANGLTAINEYLAGMLPEWAGSIAVGVLSSNSTSSATTQLDYEYLRYPVTLKSYGSASGNSRIVLKTSIDPATIFQAYELGVFPGNFIPVSHMDNFQIADFSSISSGSSTWFQGATALTTASIVGTATPRIATLMASLSFNSTASTSLTLPIPSYTENDYVDVFYYCATPITSTASLTVTFGDDSAIQNIWAASTSFASAASGAFYTNRLSFPSAASGFSGNVSTCSITFAGSNGIIWLDHMKLATGGTKTVDEMLTSRVTASGSAPLVTKTYGQPMEIEYYIQVT